MRSPFKFLSRKISQRFLLGLFCSLYLTLGLRSPGLAQTPNVNRAEIAQILDSPQVFIQNQQAKVKDTAQKGQRVRTANARAELRFNTGAVGRLAHNSVLTVGQRCARLQQGTLLVNGAVNGCTASVIAGVRGTTYVLEVTAAGLANIKVLEGEVTVSPKSDTEADGEATEPATNAKGLRSSNTLRPTIATQTLTQSTSDNPVVLKEGEKVSVRPDGAVGLVEKLSQEEFSQLLKGVLFNGFSIPLPGISKVQGSFQRLFPGVPFPISVPSIPGLPTPPVPVPFRLPF